MYFKLYMHMYMYIEKLFTSLIVVPTGRGTDHVGQCGTAGGLHQKTARRCRETHCREPPAASLPC